MNRLFVYGTLAPGQENHHVLEKLGGTWQRAFLKGTLQQRGWGAAMGCPGIVPSDQGEEVAGYVLSSDALATHWPVLDDFEGSEYQRTPVTVRLENGESIEAYVYALCQGS